MILDVQHRIQELPGRLAPRAERLVQGCEELLVVGQGAARAEGVQFVGRQRRVRYLERVPQSCEQHECTVSVDRHEGAGALLG
ncbi:MAG TPA: hypothetical protein VL242_25020 [Sorangium sp.]|nr:hypothetical protein [Sorangium sp.]